MRGVAWFGRPPEYLKAGRSAQDSWKALLQLASRVHQLCVRPSPDVIRSMTDGRNYDAVRLRVAFSSNYGNVSPTEWELRLIIENPVIAAPVDLF